MFIFVVLQIPSRDVPAGPVPISVATPGPPPGPTTGHGSEPEPRPEPSGPGAPEESAEQEPGPETADSRGEHPGYLRPLPDVPRPEWSGPS